MRKPDIMSKWLHLGMASCITLCVFMSFAMNAHTKEISWGLIWYNLHKFVGINFIVICTIYLIWSANRHGKPLFELFPWFNQKSRKALKAELFQHRTLPLYRISALVLELIVLVGIGILGVLLRITYLVYSGINPVVDPWLKHVPELAAVLVLYYLLAQVPWFNASARAGWGREFKRLKKVQTHRIASLVQGCGILIGLATTLLGLAMIIEGIFGTKFTPEMWLPKAHYYTSLVLMGYLIIHVGAALLHVVIGQGEIFKIARVLDRTTRIYVDPALRAAWFKRRGTRFAANSHRWDPTHSPANELRID